MHCAQETASVKAPFVVLFNSNAPRPPKPFAAGLDPTVGARAWAETILGELANVASVEQIRVAETIKRFGWLLDHPFRESEMGKGLAELRRMEASYQEGLAARQWASDREYAEHRRSVTISAEEREAARAEAAWLSLERLASAESAEMAEMGVTAERLAEMARDYEEMEAYCGRSL
jgi:hypothetical protein